MRDEGKEVKLGRVEGYFAGAGLGEPCGGIVKGGGGVFEAAVVGGGVDYGLLLLGGGNAGKGGREREEVKVHLGVKAFGCVEADGGYPAGEGDEAIEVGDDINAGEEVGELDLVCMDLLPAFFQDVLGGVCKRGLTPWFG